MLNNRPKVQALRPANSERKAVVDNTLALVAEQPSRREEAYERLKAAILGMQLEPGRVTSDSELSRILGMSRTPVREALTLLERELLVTRVPNHGVLIRTLTIDELIHVMQMREALDGMAARLAAGRMSMDLLIELENEFNAMMRAKEHSSEAHAALSKRLHSQILKAAGNPFLESASEVLTTSFERTRQHSWRVWDAARDAQKIAVRRYREHMEIVGALKARDARLAEKAARAHVVSGLKDLLVLLTKTR